MKALKLSCALALAVAPSLRAAPPNDNFVSAANLTTSTGFTVGVNTIDATFEAGEPSHASISGGHSVWYRFMTAARDRYTFHTGSSNFDTTLAAYSGSAVDALTEIASNDDISGSQTSRIEVTASPSVPVMIAIDGYEGDTGNAVLSWLPVALPNNNFSSAQTISGSVGSVRGFNFRATGETGEPHTGNSVWYRWTAPTGANGVITVVSNDMAPFVGVYTGSAVGSLTEVASASGAAGADVRATFTAVAGTVYRIQVKGNTGGTGDFVLIWGATGPSDQPLLPDIISVASDPDHFMYGWTLDQSQIPGRTLMRVTTATANVGEGALQLRGSSANPAVYQRIFNRNGTWTDRLAGTFTFHPTHGHLHFDGWLQFHLRAVTAGDGVGDIVAVGDKTSFAIIDYEEHNGMLPGSPSNPVYSGGLVQGISVGWRDVYSSDLDDQWIDVTSVPPGTYWLESVVDPDNHVQESDETNNVTRIKVTYNGTAPPNNNFNSAVVLTGPTAGVSGRNYSATREAGEPLHAGVGGAASIWYRWTAPATGTATISTEGSTFDTLLGVYTGSSVSGLTAVASNDNDGALTTSRVTFPVTAGTTYRIAVDGRPGAVGTVELAVNPAVNDNFSAAVTLSGGSGTGGGSTRRATAEAGEPAHAGTAAATSIWYSWTATLTGDAVFNTEGSNFNARIAVYSGNGVNSLTPVASAASSGLNMPANVLFHVDTGAVYRVAVDGGPGMLNIRWEAATALAPYIITQPASRNGAQGSNLDLTAAIGGSPAMTYQWKLGSTILTDGVKYSGANTQVLTIKKLEFADSGNYTLTGTNPSGTITTNPAHVIVLVNPRAASIQDSAGDIGGSVFAPVVFNSSGDEHGLQFTLTFDPALLSNGQITAGADAGGASIALDRSAEASGRIGVTVTLPASTVFSAGLKNLLTARFDVAGSAAPESSTTLAFEDSPVAMHAISGVGGTLPVVFDAGTVALQSVQAEITQAVVTGGGINFTIRGLRGRSYQLLFSTNLSTWTAIDTALVGPAGTVNFSVTPPAAAHGFYKSAPAP